jgi:restriction system protein
MANYVTSTSDKRKRTAFFLCLFGGLLGLHQFYVGKIGKGILYMFTLGLFLFGYFIDLFKILNGSFRDNVGQPLRQ